MDELQTLKQTASGSVITVAGNSEPASLCLMTRENMEVPVC